MKKFWWKTAKFLKLSDFQVISELSENNHKNQGCQKASVFLDCGADAASLDCGDLLLENNTIQILIPWQFDEGTCLQVTFKCSNGSGPVDAETMVVESVPCQQRANRYHTTLLVIGTKVRSGSEKAVPQLCAII